MATARQEASAMMSHFKTVFEKRFGRKPSPWNSNTLSWGFQSLLEDFSKKEAKELIEFYVENYSEPIGKYFVNNYDEVNDTMDAGSVVDRDREKLYRDTAKRILKSRREKGINDSNSN